MTGGGAALSMEELGYTQSELDEMSKEDLLLLYRSSGCQELKWPLALRYVGLVKSIALQVRGVYSSFAQVDDIINEGILALVGAIDKFDPDKGIKFETFVSKRIRGAVIDLARRQDWVPRSVRRKAREIDQASVELYSELGRCPTDEEIAGRLGVTSQQYQEDLANSALRQELLDTLAEGICSLRENEQMVVSLYYRKNLSMKEIAQVMEVSEPRISQIHSRAIQKLKLYMKQYMNGEK